jgi:hypothetical protein
MISFNPTIESLKLAGKIDGVTSYTNQQLFLYTLRSETRAEL